MPNELLPHHRAYVRAEVLAQRKLEAVKWVKATLGISLAEAKGIVDEIAATEPSSAGEVPPPVGARVGAALDDGRVQDAIDEVRRALGLGAAEARAWVDGYAAGRAAPRPEPPLGAWYDEPPR